MTACTPPILPLALSSESMTPSAPKRVAHATSVTSARDGVGDSVIERSICVATITGLFASFVFLMSIDSIKLDKPIIVHSRKAEKECIDILEKNKAKKVIMHCFNGNFNLIKRIIENKWIITIPTNVKHSQHFQKIIQDCPIDQLLCETDSPYLHPDKEYPNQPANVIESYKKIAEIKKIKLSDVESQLESNFNKLFY
jgi:TatD family hydrolase